MIEKLNKLQIRALVLDVINSYKNEDDFSSELHLKNLKTLNSIDNKNFVLEFLLRELITQEKFKLEVIKYILADYATLDMVENSIWELLKDKSIPDDKKAIYLQLLRILGGKIDVNVLMDCMQDFNAVIDQQTKDLLEVASVNPEAQIDFLDFLSSLKSAEQMQLIKSLQDDFPGDELANILSPCLRVNLSDEVKEVVIDILGNSVSYLAVKPLKNYILANEDENLKRIAIKALNQLQKDKIDIDDANLITIRENEICKNSVFYKAYLSQIDGCGNQGLIFSRIMPNEKIVMFSTVINVNDGIMDCFGLNDITVNDFRKVINRFKDNDLVVPVTAQMAKSKLIRSEQINSASGLTLPYEYLCWSVYIADIEPEDTDYTSLKSDDITVFNNDMYEMLYETGCFDTWFFEYDDNREIQLLIDFVLSMSDDEFSVIFENTERKIEDIFYKIFVPSKIDEYSLMLAESSNVFYLNNDFKRANIAINLSDAIKNGEDKFLKDVIRRSILQFLANVVSNEEEEKNSNPFTLNKNEHNISPEKAFDILRNLEQKWNGMVSYE